MTPSNNQIQDELQHYGVLGMKWGVRRSQEQLDRSSGRKSKDPDAAIKKQRKQTSATRRHLSEGDLKKAVERLQTEKKLKDLTKEDISPGKAAASKMLKQIGKTAIATAGTAVATYAIKTALESSGNPFLSGAAKFIRPKK